MGTVAPALNSVYKWLRVIRVGSFLAGLSFFALFFSAPPGFARKESAAIRKADPASYEELKIEIEQENGIRIEFEKPEISGLEAKPIPPSGRLNMLKQLQGTLDLYPPKMVSRFVVRIVLLQDMKISNKKISAFSAPATVVLSCDPKKRSDQMGFPSQFFHRFFFQLMDSSLDRFDVPKGLTGEKREVLKLKKLWDDHALFPAAGYPMDWASQLKLKAGVQTSISLESLALAFADCKREQNPPEGFVKGCGRISPLLDRASIAEELFGADTEIRFRVRLDSEVEKKATILLRMYRLASLGDMDDLYWDQLSSGAFRVPEPVHWGQDEIPKQMPAMGVPPVEKADGSHKNALTEKSAEVPKKALGDEDGKPSKPIPTLRIIEGEAADTALPRAGRRENRGKVQESVLKPEIASMHKSGLDAFQAGRVEEAEKIWREMVRNLPDEYATIQIAVNCSFDNVMKNYKTISVLSSFYTFRVNPFREPSCYTVFMGFYTSRLAAQTALLSFPVPIREAGPAIRKIGALKKSMLLE